MCNNLHKSKPIPKTGIGWKIFKVRSFGDGLAPMCKNTRSYRRLVKSKTITWNTFFQGDGFCMFLTLEEAERTLKYWEGTFATINYYVIKKIKYRRGLGKRRERKMMKGMWPMIALCKSFTIL